MKTRSSPIEHALVEAVLAAVEGDPTYAGRWRRALGLKAREDGWLDHAAAARHLGISVNALDKRARRGELPYSQPGGEGGRRLYRRSELDRALAATSPPQ